MTTEHLVPADLRALYHVKEWRNATGVLVTACPAEWEDVQDVLRSFRLMRSEVIVGGGNRSLISRRIDMALYQRGWQEKAFATSIVVDEHRIDSPTHSVDCLKGGVALEMEWNNKDPFFDRDLNISGCSLSFVQSKSELSSRDPGNCSKFSSDWAKVHPMERPPRIMKDSGRR